MARAAALDAQLVAPGRNVQQQYVQVVDLYREDPFHLREDEEETITTTETMIEDRNPPHVAEKEVATTSPPVTQYDDPPRLSHTPRRAGLTHACLETNTPYLYLMVTVETVPTTDQV
ncbi:hypothetical protein NW762_014589 [Fusarium torreyae]|uniref:Uncharacterized protein n=1 Tax=Fusarium torreyae TaxID=1237075 RepID=A0A9W8RM19_9HYPO|nr:hypothetical protein NW762_014589 [Fusarium torreyae]